MMSKAIRNRSDHQECEAGYQLLDFGEGRKLEKFGDHILDRPSPAADGLRKENPDLWRSADLRFLLESNHRGQWWLQPRLWEQSHWMTEKIQFGRPNPSNADWRLFQSADSFQWMCQLSFGTFSLKCSPFGHVGLFPEHFGIWKSIADQLGPFDPLTFRVLSLFAYTGASSICFANSSANITHVEAAKNVVQWARTNAQNSSSSGELPIRWLCEDVVTYVRREAKRKSTYEGIILDPPTYGHGPKGQVWKIKKDLPILLRQLAEIASTRLSFVLLTAHSSDYDVVALKRLFRESFLGNLKSRSNGKIVAGNNRLQVFAREFTEGQGEARGLDAGVQLLWLAD